MLKFKFFVQIFLMVYRGIRAYVRFESCILRLEQNTHADSLMLLVLPTKTTTQQAVPLETFYGMIQIEIQKIQVL